MTAHPDADVGEGELWVREGEFYTFDREALFQAAGIVALFPWDGEVYAYVVGRGRVTLHDLLKPQLGAVK
jgi:hypothetical protein